MISEKMRRKAEDPFVKSGDSDEIASQIRAFVAAGNKITVEPMGKTTIFDQRLSKSNRNAMSQNNL